MSLLKKFNIFKRKVEKEKTDVKIDDIILHFDNKSPTNSSKFQNSIGNVSIDALSIYCTQPDQAKNNVPISDDLKCSIYLSYCWFDEEQSHQIANKMAEQGFSVLFDKDKMSLDGLNAINKSDIVVICISKSYMSCDACLKEAFWSFNQDLPIIPILLVKGFKPDLWLAKIIAGKRFELITKDLKKFYYDSAQNFIFNRLKIMSSKIVERKKPLEKSFYFTQKQLTTKIVNYNAKFEKQVLKEKKSIEENKLHIEKVFDDLLNDENKFKKEFVCVYRWLHKYPNVTISNFMPFTPTGDVNDAVFVLDADTKENFKKRVQSTVSFGNQSKTLRKRTVNLCLLAKANQVKRKNEIDSATKFYMKLIKRTWKFNTNLAIGSLAWKTIENRDFNSQPERSYRDMQKRKKLDTDLSLGKKRRLQLSKYFRCETNRFCNFAEKMLNNWKEFEHACKTNENIKEPNPEQEQQERENDSINHDVFDTSNADPKKDYKLSLNHSDAESIVIDIEGKSTFVLSETNIENKNKIIDHFKNYLINSLSKENSFTTDRENNTVDKFDLTKVDRVDCDNENNQVEIDMPKFRNQVSKISPIKTDVNHPILKYEPIFFMIDFFYC